MFRTSALVMVVLVFVFGCNRNDQSHRGDQPQPTTHWLAKQWEEANQKGDEEAAKKEAQEKVKEKENPPQKAGTEGDFNIPSVTINANAFRAFLIVSKLKETKAKINIV